MFSRAFRAYHSMLPISHCLIAHVITARAAGSRSGLADKDETAGGGNLTTKSSAFTGNTHTTPLQIGLSKFDVNTISFDQTTSKKVAI
jgi:hypothetical protein